MSFYHKYSSLNEISAIVQYIWSIFINDVKKKISEISVIMQCENDDL